MPNIIQLMVVEKCVYAGPSIILLTFPLPSWQWDEQGQQPASCTNISCPASDELSRQPRALVTQLQTIQCRLQSCAVTCSPCPQWHL